MTSPAPPSGTLHTNPALLFRLKNWDDRASWREFYRLYYNFIYSFARRSGLSHADAEEVTQDVFKRVAETIGEFESDPKRGKFRGWMMQQARWRVSDKFRARPPHERRPARFVPAGEGHAHPSPIDRLPDAQDAQVAWENEWRQHVMAAAVSRLARRVPAKHFQVFDLYGRQDWPALRVARELAVNPGSVYLIHHRLTKMLRAEVRRLEEQLR